MGNKIIMKATGYCSKMKEKLIEQCKYIAEKLGRAPRLVTVIVGERKDSQMYVKMKKKKAEEIGIENIIVEIGAECTEEELLDYMLEICIAEDNDAIMVQLPLPDHLKHLTEIILDMIPYKKDVDGLTTISRGLLFGKSDKGFKCCTPKGIISLLKEYNISIAGKRVVVCGRSLEVGKPMAEMFLQENATVTMVHTGTPSSLRDKLIYSCDILVSAMGQPRKIKPYMLYRFAPPIVVDAGVTIIDGKCVGDVDEKCYETLDIYTPYTGAVGPMTIMTLMENVIQAASDKVN